MANTILVIEDDFPTSKMYQVKLEKEGFDVEIAYDGNEGIKKAKEKNPDLILLDIMMPQMNGFEALEKLKKDIGTAQIPVIIFTNIATTDQDVEKAKTLGAEEYIIKSSVVPADIVQKIRTILNKH